MTKLKRSMIEIVIGVENDEVVTKKYITPPFIPLSTVYEAVDLAKMIEDEEMTDREKTEKLIEFITNRLFGKQFTVEELTEGLHGPNAFGTLYEQLMFAANGYQSDQTKEFLAKKR